MFGIREYAQVNIYQKLKRNNCVVYIRAYFKANISKYLAEVDTAV